MGDPVLALFSYRMWRGFSAFKDIKDNVRSFQRTRSCEKQPDVGLEVKTINAKIKKIPK